MYDEYVSTRRVLRLPPAAAAFLETLAAAFLDDPGVLAMFLT